jgi:hypothetical protein
MSDTIETILKKYCNDNKYITQKISDLLDNYIKYYKQNNPVILIDAFKQLRLDIQDNKISNKIIDSLGADMRSKLNESNESRIKRLTEYKNILNNCDNSELEAEQQQQQQQHECLDEGNIIECLCRTGGIVEYLNYIKYVKDFNKLNDYSSINKSVNYYNTENGKKLDSDIIRGILFQNKGQDKSQIINNINETCEKIKKNNTTTQPQELPPPPPPINTQSHPIEKKLSPSPTPVDYSKISKAICNTHDSNIINRSIEYLNATKISEIRSLSTSTLGKDAVNELDKIDRITDEEKKQICDKIVFDLESCLLPDIRKVYTPICNSGDTELIKLYIDYFTDPSTVTIPTWLNENNHKDALNELSKIEKHNKKSNYLSQIVTELEKCLPQLKEDENTKNVERGSEAPLKIHSSDSVTFVTSEGIVYVHHDGRTMEYEGSLDNVENIREVKLYVPEVTDVSTTTEASNDIVVYSKGNFVKLTKENFEELYPITSKEYEHKNDIFTIVKKKAVEILGIINTDSKNTSDDASVARTSNTGSASANSTIATPPGT